MNSPAQPLVTVGIPVRNGGASLDQSLASLTGQTLPNLRFLISDNASDDDTQAICEAWVARDERIRYVRQPQNIGPTGNFLFVLSEARTPYFMWAAHDDFWFPEFIAENLAVLESRPDVVCCVSEVELVDIPVLPVPLIPGTAPLLADGHSNLIEYLREPGANSRIYGLYRTHVLQHCFRAGDTYWAFDWAIVARTLMWGRHALVPRTLMRRQCRGESSDALRSIPRYNRSWFTRRFPMLPFTWALLTDSTIPWTPALLRSLLHWNRVYLKNSLRRFRHRRIYPLLETLGLRPCAG